MLDDSTSENTVYSCVFDNAQSDLMHLKLYKNGDIILNVKGTNESWTWNITEMLHPKLCALVPDHVYSEMLDLWMDVESQQLKIMNETLG